MRQTQRDGELDTGSVRQTQRDGVSDTGGGGQTQRHGLSETCAGVSDRERVPGPVVEFRIPG